MPSASLALLRLKIIKPTAFSKSNVNAHTPAIKPMINLFPENIFFINFIMIYDILQHIIYKGIYVYVFERSYLDPDEFQLR